MVTRQPQVERRTAKVRLSETDVLPLCHPTNFARNGLYVVVLCRTGYGSLSISTEGAYRIDLTCTNVTVNNLRGEYLLQYKPQEPGIYLLNIKYSDDPIAGTTN